jgi:hypothetical protein
MNNKYNFNPHNNRRDIADKENIFTFDNLKEANQEAKNSKENYQMKNKNK